MVINTFSPDPARRLLRLLLLCSCAFSSLAFADPATIQGRHLVVPRVDMDDLGPVQIRFAIDTGDGISLITDSYSDADPATEVSGEFDTGSGELELYEVQLPSGKRYAALLEMASPDEPDRFVLRSARPLKNSATNNTTGNASDHAALGAVYDANCGNCHGESGLGTQVAPSLISCANCTSFVQLRDYIRDTMPLGNPNACDEACAAGMAEFILSVLNAPKDYIKSIDGLILMSDTGALRKASLQLLGRLPNAAETALVTDDPARGLGRAIDLMMEEEAFLDRVAEIFNLYLLTDKYVSRNSSEGGVRLLNRDDFPDARWFDPEDKEKRGEDYEIVRNNTNDAVAREPLELIKHVVREDRPMSEILTADYLMLSPFSARSYGVEGLAFRDPTDPGEFVEARIAGIPHAGILTSVMFLNRYPSTFTNRNRGRARVVYDYFLDTDILAIEGTRPGNAVDITTAIPTIDNPECSKCHSVLDPVASTFQNWDDRGRYRPSRLSKYGWFTDMESRGFAGKVMPLKGNADSSLQWLAGEIVKDPRFARAMVRIMVRGLTGKEPLATPGEGAPQAEQEAWLSERAILTDIQQAFVADRLNLKTLVREILLSPYWQATGLDSGADPDVHDDTGAISLLGPEQLNKKLSALTGIEWRGSLDNYHKNIGRDWEARLLNRNYYQQIYGGIDSDSVVKPLTEPNGLMGAVQYRMANEMACYAVPNDFLNQKLGRDSEVRLFPFVTMTTQPWDEDGNPDNDGMQRIRQNIRYLHALLLGEERSFDDPEFAFTEDLFLDVLASGQAEIAATEKKWEVNRLPSSCKRHRDLVTGEEMRDEEKDIDNRLMEDPDYTIRSWMAVVAYLLADYRFVYE